ncbi:MAG: hypothetical protein H7Z74_10525 [Anaerolineae bacterium]|nr:hypothetical protein [Gemmatimonadaceae bacterium]
MTPGTTIVFVNSARVTVARGATVLDAVRAWDEREGAAVEVGDRVVTDSRGLPAALDTVVHGGAIFRIMTARARAGGDGS